MNTPLKTTVVGSFPVPDWLKASPSEQTLKDAVTVVLRAQERAGLDVISDGELGRWDMRRGVAGGMVERFVMEMEGIQPELSWSQRRAFQSRADMRYRPEPPGVVVGPLAAGRLDLCRDWDRAQQLTQRPLKVTVTSPYMLAKVVQDDYYRDLERLSLAFAEVLAPQLAEIKAAVVQVDEPNLPGTPADSPIAARAVNRLLEPVQAEKALHICFGNFGGQRIQEGHYQKLVAFINDLQIRHIVLETTRREAAELEQLKAVRPEIKLGLGVIDVKDLQIESPEQVCRRIDGLGRLFGVERIGWVHPDCGLQHLPRTVAERKLQALVAGRDLFLGARPAGGSKF
jgi:5-methyltetrahydropteroyltriglutamate--homocysteine methyltransferase